MASVMDMRAVWEPSAGQRGELVRLCRWLTGDSEAAEDLAQETLLEAWRHLQQLRDPDGESRWLAAIARNVYLRWRRRQGQERKYRDLRVSQAQGGQEADREERNPEDDIADALDVEVELERDELAQLLDRALALLPPETRQVLIDHYIRESPVTEVAAHLGASPAATAKKLQRGKVAFRQVLTTHLRAEAAAYGLVSAEPDTWQETRLWCTCCGQQHLLGRFSEHHTRFQLRCPTCCHDPMVFVANACLPDLFRDAKSYKPAYARLLDWCAAHARVTPDGTIPPCLHCRQPMRLAIQSCSQLTPDYCLRCPACGWKFDFTLSAHVFTLPSGRQFWQEHPRARLLPTREIEAAGGPAYVTSYEDRTGQARLDVICARDSLIVLGIHGDVPSIPNSDPGDRPAPSRKPLP